MSRILRSIFGPALLLLALAPSLAAQQARYRDLVFAQVSVQRDLVYGAAVNRFSKRTELLKLDLYTPSGDRAPMRAAVVIVHGGGFVSGDKGTSQFIRLGTDLARRGFLAISINYRMRPRSAPGSPQDAIDAAHDCKAAVRWLRKNKLSLKLDEGRIACLGSSAGAVTCLEAAYVPGEGNSGNPGFSSAVQAVVDLWGLLRNLNALQHGEAPVSIIHGTRDRTVAFTNATALKKQADLVGVPAELHPIQNAGHAPWSRYFASFHVQHAVPFLWQRLALGQLAGLAARPGWTSPGRLLLDSFGIAGDRFVLLASARRKSIPVPPLGIFCLDPLVTVSLPAASFATSPRLPQSLTTLTVPAGLKGQIHWQAVHLTAGTPWLLTDCVTTGF